MIMTMTMTLYILRRDPTKGSQKPRNFYCAQLKCGTAGLWLAPGELQCRYFFFKLPASGLFSISISISECPVSMSSV